MENIVIGSGPAGRLAALELGKLNEKVLLIEKNHIGGTCCNEGCMVICALTDVTKFIDKNNRFNKHGFIKSQLEVSYDKIVAKIKQTQTILRAINQLENEKIGNNVIFGEARISGNEVIVNNESYNYDNLLIATGARPYIPKILGSQHGLTNKDILKLDEIPEKLNVIGGGIIACEIANIYSKLGSEVNIFARSSFLKDIDETTKNYIIKHLIPEIEIYENTSIIEVNKNEVNTIKFEKFEGVPFFATGRVPNSEIVNDIVSLNNDNSIKVNKMMKTNVDNIYAAGDVTGGIQLTPVARMEGICAARNIAGYTNKVSYDAIAQSITLNMDVGIVKDERVSDENLKTISTPGLGGPDAYWNILTKDTGFTKIAIDEKENKIKEINSIGANIVDDIAYQSYLMRINQDLEDFDEFVEIHPSCNTASILLKRGWL